VIFVILVTWENTNMEHFSCSVGNISMSNMTTISDTNCSVILSNDMYANLLRQTEIALFFISIALSPVTIIGNLMVEISMYKFRNLRTVTNMFIGSLAMADFLLGLITLPMYALFYIDSEFARYKQLCLLKYSTVLLSMSGSLYSLVAIAVDRYIAILRPLKYPVIMTRHKAKIIISAIWVYHVILGVIPSMGWNNYDKYNGEVCDFFRILPLIYTIVSCPGTIIVSLIVCMYFYMKIFTVAAHQLKKKNLRHQSSSQQQFRKDARSARAMGMILFFFFIFWTPFMVTGPLKYLDIPANLSEMIKNFGMTIAMSNSAINPIMYCWLRNDFRDAFKRILCSCCLGNGENQRNPSVTKSTISVRIK